MAKKDILYLGSESSSRQRLVAGAEIDYRILKHDSDECVVEADFCFQDYVLEIAKEKMRHLVLPCGLKDGQNVFVLTADTLVRTLKTHTVLGKPKDQEDALRMLRLLRAETVEVITGCCLEKKIFKNESWHVVDFDHFTMRTTVDIDIAEDELLTFLEKMPGAMKSSGSFILEGFGQNFFKSICGSYTSVLGLPIYEVRGKLKKMGFNF